MSDDLIELEQKQKIGIIAPEGEIVFENSNPLKEETKTKIKREDIENLIIDLSSVSYLDSSGIGYIISIFKFMRQREGEMVITNLNSKVKRVCELTKLNDIIGIYESVEEAKNNLK